MTTKNLGIVNCSLRGGGARALPMAQRPVLERSSHHRHEVRAVLEFAQVLVLVHGRVSLRWRHHLHDDRRLLLGWLSQVHHTERIAPELREEVVAGMHALADVHTAQVFVLVTLGLVGQVIVQLVSARRIGGVRGLTRV